MDEPNYEKLVSYIRNGLEEQCHFGLVLHINKNGIISRFGEDNGYKFYHRSCMKPLQIAPLIDFEIDRKFGFTDEEIAVCAASHTGDIEHQQKVLSILDKIGCKEDDLLCLPHEPLSKMENARLLLNGLKPSKLHNNCSGKHAAMLAICKFMNFDISNYNDLSHPLTELIINKVCNLCEISREEIVISKDGCSLPVIATPLYSLGKGFLNLYTNPKYKRILKAVKQYPYLAGGKGRLDSEIMSAGENLVSKVGACGLCVVVNVENEEALIVKIADSNIDARAFVVTEILKKLKWLKQTQVCNSHFSSIINNDIFTQYGENVGIVSLRMF
ncbi:asparaginase [bacterium]|nr:asparaginase [bacterium]